MNFYASAFAPLSRGHRHAGALPFSSPAGGPALELRNWKHLLIVGFPLFLAAELYGFWPLLDRSLVRACVGVEGMGSML